MRQRNATTKYNNETRQRNATTKHNTTDGVTQRDAQHNKTWYNYYKVKIKIGASDKGLFM
jgi:hypothetical protein